MRRINFPGRFQPKPPVKLKIMGPTGETETLKTLEGLHPAARFAVNAFNRAMEDSRLREADRIRFGSDAMLQFLDTVNTPPVRLALKAIAATPYHTLKSIDDATIQMAVTQIHEVTGKLGLISMLPAEVNPVNSALERILADAVSENFGKLRRELNTSRFDEEKGMMMTGIDHLDSILKKLTESGSDIFENQESAFPIVALFGSVVAHLKSSSEEEMLATAKKLGRSLPVGVVAKSLKGVELNVTPDTIRCFCDELAKTLTPLKVQDLLQGALDSARAHYAYGAHNGTFVASENLQAKKHLKETVEDLVEGVRNAAKKSGLDTQLTNVGQAAVETVKRAEQAVRHPTYMRQKY